MATSSITKNFVIEGVEQAEKFANAIEESFNDPTPPVKVSVTKIHGQEQLMELMAKREKRC